MALADEIIGEMRGKRTPPKKDEPADEPADDVVEEPGGDEDAIAQELVDAVDSGDASGVASALKSFIRACYPNLEE